MQFATHKYLRDPRKTSTNSKAQLEAILHDALDVEALCGHGMCDVFRCQGLQDGGLARIVQAQNQDPSLHFVLVPADSASLGSWGLTLRGRDLGWTYLACHELDLRMFTSPQ